MSMKPILFSTPMVQAILEGKKTQTRRVVKQKYSNTDIVFENGILYEVQNDTPPDSYDPITKRTTMHVKVWVETKPKYQPRDILWVRETWANTWTPCGQEGFVYKADGIPTKFPYWGNASLCKDEVWRPSIFMPREAARIFLRVTNVRVERLQEITEDDARAEGVITNDAVKVSSYVCWFRQLWDSLNAKRGYGWDANPWVRGYEFQVISKEEAVG